MLHALYQFLYWFLVLMIYSCIGWVYETTLCSITGKKLVNRGFLTGPVCPVYGFGALLVLCTVGSVEGVLPLFLSAAVVTCVVEYITAWLLEKFFQAKWWDYSDRRFNLHGRVCLEGAVVFGLLSVLLVKVVHPKVTALLEGMGQTTLVLGSTGIFLVFCVDLADTVRSLMVMNGRMAEIQAAIDQHKAELERFGAELRELAEESRAELKLRGGETVNELRRTLEEREERRQSRMAELKESLALRFEESRFNTARIRLLGEKRRWQERRLLRAFPNMRSQRYSDAMEALRRRLEERKK